MKRLFRWTYSKIILSVHRFLKLFQFTSMFTGIYVTNVTIIGSFLGRDSLYFILYKFREKCVYKWPKSSVDRAAKRYSKGPGFKLRSGCTVFSPCHIWRPTWDRNCTYSLMSNNSSSVGKFVYLSKKLYYVFNSIQS
jgi:hypothetical protein